MGWMEESDWLGANMARLERESGSGYARWAEGVLSLSPRLRIGLGARRRRPDRQREGARDGWVG